MSSMGERKSHLTNASTFMVVKREGEMEKGRETEGERKRDRKRGREG